MLLLFLAITKNISPRQWYHDSKANLEWWTVCAFTWSQIEIHTVSRPMKSTVQKICCNGWKCRREEFSGSKCAVCLDLGLCTEGAAWNWGSGKPKTVRVSTNRVDVPKKTTILLPFSFTAIFLFFPKLCELTLKKAAHTEHLNWPQWPFLPFRIRLLSSPYMAVPANPVLHIPRPLFPVQFLLGNELLFFSASPPSPQLMF